MLTLREYSKKEMRLILANPSITNPAAPGPGIRPMNEKKFQNYVKGLLSDKEASKKLNGHRLSYTQFKNIRILPVPLVRLLLNDSEIKFQE